METLDYLAKHISKLISQGSFKKVNAPIAARAFLGMIIHYSMLQEIYGLKRFFKVPVKKVVDIFVDIFFEGMEARHA